MAATFDLEPPRQPKSRQKNPPAPRGHASPASAGHIGTASVSSTGGNRDYTIAVGAGFAPFLTPLIQLVDRVIDYLSAVDPPSVGGAMESYLRGEMTTAQYECAMRLNGADVQAHAPVVRSRYERPTWEQTE